MKHLTQGPTLGQRAKGRTLRPLVVIVGETASGKSALGMEIARAFDGEIICADSRTVYKGMDIGTAKPSMADRAEVPHHLLDIVQPDERFTAADFKQKALEAIGDIRQRGKLSVMVGGTGLYVDAVVYNYTFRSAYDVKIRQELENKSLEELRSLTNEAGFTTYSDSSNKRHLIRILEAGLSPEQDRRSIIPNVVIIGIKLTPAELRKRITKRASDMFRSGIVQEVKELAEKYGWEHEAMTGIIYRTFKPYLDGKQSLTKTKRELIQNDLNLAKKQRTWFKRNPNIVWFHDPKTAFVFISGELN